MQEREKFKSRLGFIMVSAGCAIGLGNVWKFPYICGENGGAAFILIYLLFLAILGWPILMAEFAVGRGSKRSIAQSFSILETEKSNWHRFKWFGIAGNYLLMMFYTMVCGWMLYYAWRMITGQLSGLDTKGTEAAFNQMLESPVTMILWTVIAIAVSFGICAMGLQNGVEKITKVMMILLIVLMLVLAVNSVLLDTSGEGLKFYLVPDFSKTAENGWGNVIFAAMTHAFFTLSVGMGSMSIFGSYLDKEHKITTEALNVVILDTIIAITAGIIIIPSCFAYGIQPDAGPSLLFITLPNVFNHMAGGRIWGSLFFIFMTFASLSTVIAVFENIIAITMEIWDMTRAKAVKINMFLIMILSMPAVLGYNVLSGIQPIGVGSTIMDLEDFLVSYNILPLGGLVFLFFCTSKNGWGFDNFRKEVNTGKGFLLPAWIKGYMAYVLPLIIVLVYLKGYYDMFSKYEAKTFIMWMLVAVVFLAVVISFSLKAGKKAAGKRKEF
ncbi:MAG: sodium-dependent transporter [Lachnospira sp.]|nr:sodium-dependent transporter [Lachnospira sp.]